MINFRDFVHMEMANEPHYMVVGHPIGHSLSPLMHGVALEEHGMEVRYHAIDLRPDELNSFLAWVNRDSFLGANITIPYKQDFLLAVDRLDEAAREIGAVNTLVKLEGEIVGYNTDAPGFQAPLEPWREVLEGGTAILFGTGGASLAVRYALRQLGMEQLIMVSRNPGRINVEDVICCNYQNWQAYAGQSDLIVNSTPLGMSPNRESSPVQDQDIGLLEGTICYDLVYNPLETRFLEQAKEAGAEVIDGLEMFVGQGDRAFELWTDHRFPWKKVKERVREELAS